MSGFGSGSVPTHRLGEQGDCTGAHCRECGVKLGAGYLCDECDTIEIDESV